MGSDFGTRLAERVRARQAPVVVGLDPRRDQLPPRLVQDVSDDPSAIADAYREFCNGVVDAVASLVPAVKPQAAFFEQLGAPGVAALVAVIQHARKAGLLVILDGKRNDIGSTAAAYADGMLGTESAFGADALTVSPYLGRDSLTPFVNVATARDAGLFVLVKTSNPGGRQFQDLLCDGRPLYQHVAEEVGTLNRPTVGSEGYGAVGAVVGATYPEQLMELRATMPATWFLVPGYGHQGAGAADVAGAFDENGLGAVVNSSRGIIFAHERPEFAKNADASWQDAVAAAAQDMIDALRAETPAGRL